MLYVKALAFAALVMTVVIIVITFIVALLPYLFFAAGLLTFFLIGMLVFAPKPK